MQCLASGAVFSSLCAAVVVPVLVWLGVRALTPAIAAMNDDPRWQSALASIAAVLPGGLFLMLVVFGIVDGAGSPCLQIAAGRIMYGLLSLLVAGAIVRALIRAYLRERELHELLGSATPARGRAAEIAARVGVPLFQLEGEHEMIVVAAGSPRPGVYASDRALHEFDDMELRAALFHDRRHIERGDHRIAPWLYFFADLLPLPGDALVDV